MTQQQLDRAVAKATGESLCEIRHRGFSIADPADVAFDPEPEDLPPQFIDWDDYQAVEPARPCRRRKSVSV
jgi:hypothetical protein